MKYLQTLFEKILGIAGVEPAPPDYETDTLPLRHTPLRGSL
jgi:hypothetical protein